MSGCSSVADFIDCMKRSGEWLECVRLSAKLTKEKCHAFQQSCKTYHKYWDYETNQWELRVNALLISCYDCPNWISPNVEEIKRTDFDSKRLALARGIRNTSLVRPFDTIDYKERMRRSDGDH